jgi:hypothetical protein
MTPSKRTRTPTDDSGSLRFSPVNGILGLAGLVSLVAGYWLLSTGSITLAPLLLVLAYVVLLPLAIIK